MSTKKIERRKKWEVIVNEFNNSGLTQADFSRKNNVDAKLLSSWVRKFKNNELPNQHSPQQWVMVEPQITRKISENYQTH